MAYMPEPTSTGDSPPMPSCNPSTNRDADNKVSPATSPNSYSPVKQQFSHIFGRRRVQPHQPLRVDTPPPVDNDDIPHHVQTKLVQRSAWAYAMLKKSRNLLRKTYQNDESSENALGGLDRPKEFRLLYIERITTKNAAQVTDPDYRRQYWLPESIGNYDASAQEIEAGRENNPSRKEEPSPATLTETGAKDGNFIFKNSIPYINVKRLRQPCPQLEDIKEEEWYISNRDRG